MCSRLGIDVAVEGDKERSGDSQKEDDLAQPVDRAGVALNPPESTGILARVQRGDGNDGPRDEQLHDEENLGQPLVAVGEVLRDVVPTVSSTQAPLRIVPHQVQQLSVVVF